MGKVVKFYQNQKDYEAFCDFIFDQELRVYTFDMIEQDKTSMKNDQRTLIFFILSMDAEVITQSYGNVKKMTNDTEYIEFCPCGKRHNGVVEEGALMVHTNDEKTNEIFMMLKNFIRTKYDLIDNKTAYVAPGFYADWLNRKVVTTYFLKRQETKLLLHLSDRADFINWVQKQGLAVTSLFDNNKKLDFNSEVIVIYDPAISDMRKFFDPKQLYNHNKSVFLIKNKNYSSLIIDYRLVLEKDPALKIYNKLVGYFIGNNIC